MTTRPKKWLLRASGADLVAATVLMGGLIGSLVLGSRVTGVQHRADAA